MKIFLTGASGFIGANLARKLLVKKHEVHVILRDPKKAWRLQEILSQLKVHQVDLLDADKLTRLVKKIKPTAVIHCATYGMFMGRQKDVELMLDTNIKVIKNLCFAALESGCQKIINTGTSSEYGIKTKPMSETDSLEPVNMYGSTKAAATIIASQIAREHNLQLVTMRLFAPYGPWEEPGRLIPTIITSQIKNSEIKLGSKIPVRDFIYIDDICEAYLKALNTKLIPGDIFNLGTGKQTSLLKLAQLMKAQVTWGEYQPVQQEPKIWRAQTAHSQKLLGWHAKTDLTMGLKKTKTWFKAHLSYY